MTLTLLLSCVIAQISFTELNEITLQTDNFSFEKVFPTPEGLMVCNHAESLVMVFDKEGGLLASLGSGSGDESMILPVSASWLPSAAQYYVYDAATRKFHVWDADYKFVKKLDTDFPSFFEVGPLVEAEKGFAAAVSLQDGRYLVGRFDENFGNIKFGYEVADKELKLLSPVLHRTFVVKADMYGGLQLVAAQTLGTIATILDMKLQEKNTVSLAVPGWKDADLNRLGKVSKNPKEFKKLYPTFSEIVALQNLQGTLVVVGFRNILNGDGYYFQCYDVSTGNALGQTFNAAHPPVGSGYGRLYLRPGNKGMKLQPVLIR